MPKQLNNGRITESLQRAFGFKGRFQPMLDEVVVPVYQIADPVPAVPQRTYFASHEIAAVAGERGRIRVKNPTTSGVVLQISSITIGANPNAGIVNSEALVANAYPSDNSFDALTNVVTPRARDFRNLLPAKAIVSDDTTALPPGPTFARAIVTTDAILADLTRALSNVDRQPLIVLQPGVSLEIMMTGTNAENVPIVANWQWLEVAIQQQPFSGIPG